MSTHKYDTSPQRVGDFAEYFVACDLISQGYRVHFASAGAYFDIILDDKGKLYRVQVKGSMKPKDHNMYKYNVLANLGHTNFDLVAYVAIDKKMVAYEVVPSVNHRYISITRFESMTIARAIADFNAK